MFRKVLIANRGEIAIRIARSLRELGVPSVALFTEADRASSHVGFADEALCLGPEPRAYLDIERIVAAARRVGADALHPGYGFLSENADFALACERAGIVFVGPPASAIAAMGSKQRARAAMSAAGVPIVPGGPADSLEEAEASALRAGYPVLVKATDGGGGKGMRRVDSPAELASAWERTRSEALSAFGSDRVYIEKALVRARHVEIQILGDRHGNLIHLYERDCSLQRRHQKILEETPCPALPAATLERMSSVALAGARSLGYFSAGTFEFLLAADGSFYFLEMNTRLQVEHPVTELVTGVDLVRQMLRVAAGETISAETPPRRGAAIEVRVYAEDPASGFLPSPGDITRLCEPSGPGVRIDSGIEAGSSVGTDYDPLLAKLAVWGEDRAHAIARLQRALGEYFVSGVDTNIAFLQRLSADAAFRRGEYDTEFVVRRRDLTQNEPLPPEDLADWTRGLAALEEMEQAEQRAKQRRYGAAVGALSPWVQVERARLR
jgi:acetyl-CoA carboxylase biotin carboxylase subunit